MYANYKPNINILEFNLDFLFGAYAPKLIFTKYQSKTLKGTVETA